MASEAEKQFSKSTGELALWASVLTGPIIWFVQMQLKYQMVAPACQSGNQLLLHMIALVALIITAGAGLLGWRLWRETGRELPNEAAGVMPRSRFMAFCGLILSITFFLVIIAQEIPDLFVSACER